MRHFFSGRPLEVCHNVIFWIQPMSLTCVLTTIGVSGVSHSKLPTVCSYDSCYLTWSTKTSIKTLLCVLLFSMGALEVKFRAAAGIFWNSGHGNDLTLLFQCFHVLDLHYKKAHTSFDRLEYLFFVFASQVFSY